MDSKGNFIFYLMYLFCTPYPLFVTYNLFRKESDINTFIVEVISLPSLKPHKLGGGAIGKRVPEGFVCEKKYIFFKLTHLSGSFSFFRSEQQALLAHQMRFAGEKRVGWINSSENPVNDSVHKPVLKKLGTQEMWLFPKKCGNTGLSERKRAQLWG